MSETEDAMADGCDAETKITIGAPGPMSLAVLVCSLDTGHESLHFDDTDCVWWRPGEPA